MRLIFIALFMTFFHSCAFGDIQTWIWVKDLPPWFSDATPDGGTFETHYRPGQVVKVFEAGTYPSEAPLNTNYALAEVSGLTVAQAVTFLESWEGVGNRKYIIDLDELNPPTRTALVTDRYISISWQGIRGKIRNRQTGVLGQ